MKTNLRTNNEGLGRPWMILIIVLSVLVVGGIGYMIGQNQAESDAKARLDEETQSLQQQLDEAKNVATDQVQEGEQTEAELESENTQLKSQIEDLEDEIDDLEQELEDAQSNNNTTNSNTTN